MSNYGLGILNRKSHDLHVNINISLKLPHFEGFISFDQAAILRKLHQWQWVKTLLYCIVCTLFNACYCLLAGLQCQFLLLSTVIHGITIIAKHCRAMSVRALLNSFFFVFFLKCIAQQALALQTKEELECHADCF